MRCEDLHAHVADHLAGTLEPPLADEVAAHLRDCPACAREIEALDDTWHLLGTVRADRPDSAAMRTRFHAALEGYQQGVSLDTPPAHMPRGRVLRVRSYAMQFAAAAAMLVLGVAIGRQTVAAPPADPQLGALRDELRDMREMVTISLLQQQSASERLKGLTLTSGIDQPDTNLVRALLDTLMHDPNVNVRLATIDALRRFAGSDAVRRGIIEAVPRQTAPFVQIALIDFLVEVDSRAAAPTLRQMTMDPMLDEAVRARAEARLRQIS